MNSSDVEMAILVFSLMVLVGIAFFSAIGLYFLGWLFSANKEGPFMKTVKKIIKGSGIVFGALITFAIIGTV